jgi:methionine-rich copper-binding protein CopC
MRGILRRLGLAAGIGVVATLAVAAPAWAHNYYVSSTPGMNEVLTALPDTFIVTTNDNLLDLGGHGAGFIMEVKGPDGLYYGDGCVTVTGPSVSMPAALGPAGDYTLEWQVVSADGHTVSGEVPFSWAPPVDAVPSAGAASAPHCGTEAVGQGDTGQGAASGADDSVSDALWIGGAVVAVALAVVATLLLLRKKPE